MGESFDKLKAQKEAILERRASSEIRIGKWLIEYDPPPIPSRNCDWHYTHEDDDGAPDGSAARSGHCASLADCLREIADLMDEAQP